MLLWLLLHDHVPLTMRRSVVLLAWYFLLLSDYGRVYTIGPFDTQQDCERMRSHMRGTGTKYCWYTEGRP